MNTFLDQVYQAFDANILFLFFDGGDDPNKTLLLLLMFGERIFYSSSCPFSAMNKHAGSVVEQFSARSNTNSQVPYSWNNFSGPLWLSGFVCAFNPGVLDLNPKHTICAFSLYIVNECVIFCAIRLRKGRK